MSTILALETSCDETAVAIMRGSELLASEVASQTAAHQPYGGVVPEVASRNHLVHAPGLLASALETAGVSVDKIDAFAATSGPGLASSLMIGTSIAKGLAIGTGKPYLAVNHLEGHLLSPFFPADTSAPGARRSVEASFLPPERFAMTEHRAPGIEPNVSLVVSGGHTLLVNVSGLADYKILGRTVDDATGEAFDKVAKMLGLGYPGGPEIERRARCGDPARFDFPRSMINSRDHNFSFSGLKTAVRYLLLKHPPERDEQLRADLCASFQAAVIDVLVQKTIVAAQESQVSLVTLSGGVSCNGELRKQMESACRVARLEFRAAESFLSTDNAAMIAWAAAMRFAKGFASDVADEIDPNLKLA